MEIVLLGPVGLEQREGGDGLPALGSDQLRVVLASLALEPGRPVTLDALVDRVWDGHPPDGARNSVYTLVSRLRKALRKAAGGDTPPTVERRAHSYVLRVAQQESVDWQRYARTAARALDLAATGGHERAARLFHEAEQLWQGQALAGLPGVWAARTRAHMEERRRRFATARTGVELRLGRYTELVGELAPLVAAHPADEELVRQYMIAAYGSGRAFEALQQYEATRRTLRETLGTNPGARLAGTHRRILHQVPVEQLLADPGPAGRGGTAAPAGTASGGDAADADGGPGPRATGAPSVRVLPRYTPPVGRRAELARIRDAVEQAEDARSVITLFATSGMAGVGKTTVALHTATELAHRFPSVIYLDLRTHALQGPLGPADALAELLRHLDVPAAQIPRDLSGRSALWQRLLADRRVLVILDDAVGAEQVLPLLPGATSPSFTLVASRRRIVGLPGSRSMAMDVLPTEDAVALFRAHADDERTLPEEATAEIRRIVDLCGGLPLALSLTANRLAAHPSWSLDHLRRRLSGPSRLGEIRTAENDLERVFDFSYQTLTPGQQAAFRTLSLTVTQEFGTHAAAALLGRTPAAAERELEFLQHCNLLGEPAPARWRFHDLVAEYAQSRAEEEDPPEQRAAAQQRLVHFYLATADRADRLRNHLRVRLADVLDGLDAPAPEGPELADHDDALEWLTAERGNLLAVAHYAFTAGHPALGARLASALAPFLMEECLWGDAARLHRQAAEFLRSAGDEARLWRALLDLSEVHLRTGAYPEVARAAHEAWELSRQLERPEACAEPLVNLGILAWHRSDFEGAVAYLAEAMGFCTSAEQRWLKARCLNNSAIVQLHLGRDEHALSLYLEAVTLFRAVNDEANLAKTLNNVGELFLRKGETEKANSALDQALALSRKMRNRVDQASIRTNIAEGYAASGRFDESAELYAAGHAVFEELGDRKSAIIALNGLGWVQANLGRHEQAVTHLREALRLAAVIGSPLEETHALRLLAHVELERGRVSEGAELAAEALVVADRVGSATAVVQALVLLAEARHRTGRADEAAPLWARVRALLPQVDKSAVAQVRARLDSFDG